MGKILQVLRTDQWPAFDGQELEEMERRILDEAAEAFGEPVEHRHGSSSVSTDSHPCIRQGLARVSAEVAFDVLETSWLMFCEEHSPRKSSRLREGGLRDQCVRCWRSKHAVRRRQLHCCSTGR